MCLPNSVPGSQQVLSQYFYVLPETVHTPLNLCLLPYPKLVAFHTALCAPSPSLDELFRFPYHLLSPLCHMRVVSGIHEQCINYWLCSAACLQNCQGTTSGI